MKAVFCLAVFLLPFMACDKPGTGHYNLDNAMYLTLQTGGQSYSTYGYTDIHDANIFGGPEISFTNTPDSTGAAQVQAGFIAVTEIQSAYDATLFSMGNCYADWYMSKPGTDKFGSFINFIGSQTTQIIRIGDVPREYWFDKKSFIFTITKQDIHKGRSTMEGSFSGILHLASDTAVIQTVSGSFRAYVK